MASLTPQDVLLLALAVYPLALLGAAALVAAAIAGFGKRLADAVSDVRLTAEFVQHKVIGNVTDSTFNHRTSLAEINADEFSDPMLTIHGNSCSVTGNRFEAKKGDGV